MPAYSAGQRNSITSFVEITGANTSTAAKYLREAKWSVQHAVNNYLNARIPSRSDSTPALSQIFDKYRDDPKDNPNQIGIEGAMSYLNDIGVPLDEVVCLGMAQLLRSDTIGEFKRDKFIEGWKSVPKVTTIEAMKAHAQSLRTKIPSDLSLFRKIYKYTFPVSRMPPARTLPVEIALDQWQLLFTSDKGGIDMNTPSTPWLDLWLEFVKTKVNRPINKDLWEQIEVFLEAAKNDESLDWHSEDGAWPGAIDEFVVFVREKRGQNGR